MFKVFVCVAALLVVFQFMSAAALPLDEQFGQVPVGDQVPGSINGQVSSVPINGQVSSVPIDGQTAGQVPVEGVDTDDRHLLGLLFGHHHRPPFGGLGGGLGFGGLGGGLGGPFGAFG